MDHPTAAAWVGIIVAVIAVLTAIIVWGLARHHHRHHSGLQVSLVEGDAGLWAADAPAEVAFLNLRLHNPGAEPVIVDGLGYRRAGSHRLVPVRRFDAPDLETLDAMADLLVPPPYHLAPGESRDVTLYAPALCGPDELTGLYLHMSDGELVWLPRGELQRLTHACSWVSQERG
ncbi:MAG: hypothetical protein GXY68_01490 [Chloroflexi bacterium]|nr:hypothetical protein [Chloroflexota bacterium]